MRLHPVLRLCGAWLAAVLLAAALGTLAQTQVNLAALQALGAEIPFALRLRTSAQDLLGFGPGWAGVIAAGFLVALPAAAWLARWRPAWRGALCALAGGVAVLVALLAMRQVFSLMPLSAARGLGGTLALALAGALGGALFAALTGPGRRRGR